MAGIVDDLKNISDQAVEGKAPPSSKFVDWFHGKVSRRRTTDIHHQIGFGEGDVAAGGHTHDGKDSYGLWDATSIPADLSASPTNAQIATTVNSILALMRQKGA